MATKNDIQDMAAQICSALTTLGCDYHFEADNRSNRKSVYIYVRRPKYTEIRVSDHPIGKVQRRKTFDVGPHGLPVEQAIKELSALMRT